MARPAILRKEELAIVQQDAVRLILARDAHRAVERVLPRPARRAKPGLAVNEHRISLGIALRPLGMFTGDLTALKLGRLTAGFDGRIEQHAIARRSIRGHPGAKLLLRNPVAVRQAGVAVVRVGRLNGDGIETKFCMQIPRPIAQARHHRELGMRDRLQHVRLRDPRRGAGGGSGQRQVWWNRFK